MTIVRRFIVRGRVQGVFFRDSTRRVAEGLGLTGYAINLDNGDVEVLCCGESSSVDELASWLREGPPLSRVDEVLEQAAEDAPPGDFTTG